MSLQSPEKIVDIDAAFTVQYGIYFTDTDEIQGGFEDVEDAYEHALDLVSHGTIYSHEYKIVKILVEIEEVK